jgi:hypothetical protein
MKAIRLLFCLIFVLPSFAHALNFVRVAENNSMTVYVDVDSIAKEGGYITANQIKEYKIPMDFGGGKTFRSSLGLAEIDCKLNVSRIAFLDTFELNGLKGKLLSHGVQVPMVSQIKPNTMTADVRDFLCAKAASTLSKGLATTLYSAKTMPLDY